MWRPEEDVDCLPVSAIFSVCLPYSLKTPSVNFGFTIFFSWADWLASPRDPAVSDSSTPSPGVKVCITTPNIYMVAGDLNPSTSPIEPSPHTEISF